MLQQSSGSVVVVEAGGPNTGDLPAGVFDTLEALRGIDVPGGVSPATWQRTVDGISERTFYHHRAGLLPPRPHRQRGLGQAAEVPTIRRRGHR